MSETSDNLPQVEAALRTYLSKVDQASGAAMSLIARQMYDNAKKNADTGKNPPRRVNGRLRYNPHIPGTGPGPNRGTGNLLRSMSYSSRREGFGSYQATASVGMVYAKALELGNPKWTSGVKYPYMEPALRQLVERRQLQQILAYSFSRLKG